MDFLGGRWHSAPGGQEPHCIPVVVLLGRPFADSKLADGEVEKLSGMEREPVPSEVL